MKNQNGVTVNLVATTQGVKFALGGAGVVLRDFESLQMREGPMRIASIRYTSFARSVLLGLVVAGALFGPVSSLSARMSGHPRPIRIEGYWERGKADAAIIAEVTISAAGHPRRAFGISALQAYKPAEEGAHILRHSNQRPITLLLTGHKEMIERFLTARPDQKVVALGLYRAGAGQLVLSSVETPGAPDAAATPRSH